MASLMGMLAGRKKVLFRLYKDAVTFCGYTRESTLNGIKLILLIRYLTEGGTTSQSGYSASGDDVLKKLGDPSRSPIKAKPVGSKYLAPLSSSEPS